MRITNHKYMEWLMSTGSNSQLKLKKLKYQIKNFETKLNKEQQDANKLIEQKTLTVLNGKAGSGKTLLSCFAALKKFSNYEIDRIIVTRPTVSTEDNGFLPGGIDDKLGPWIAPIYSNFRTILQNDSDPTSIEMYDHLIGNKVLEIVPLTFMRGRTFTNACIIIDEAQNLTEEQVLMVISRIGIGSNMVICGDGNQIDLKYRNDSAIRLLERLPSSDNIGKFTLLKNHRHPIVDEVLSYYETMMSTDIL